MKKQIQRVIVPSLGAAGAVRIDALHSHGCSSLVEFQSGQPFHLRDALIAWRGVVGAVQGGNGDFIVIIQREVEDGKVFMNADGAAFVPLGGQAA